MTLTCPHCTKAIQLQINPEILKGLTPAEIQLIQAKMSRGESNKELANRLGTSEQVIKNRLRDIYSAFRVHSAVEMAILWFRNVQPQSNPKSGQVA